MLGFAGRHMATFEGQTEQATARMGKGVLWNDLSIGYSSEPCPAMLQLIPLQSISGKLLGI
jgi:hypothetical protein